MAQHTSCEAVRHSLQNVYNSGFTFKSSGMRSRVVRWVVHDVSKGPVAFILRVKQSESSGLLDSEDEGNKSFRNVGTAHAATRRHISDDVELQDPGLPPPSCDVQEWAVRYFFLHLFLVFSSPSSHSH
jgi:hypothetical protein